MDEISGEYFKCDDRWVWPRRYPTYFKRDRSMAVFFCSAEECGTEAGNSWVIGRLEQNIACPYFDNDCECDDAMADDSQDDLSGSAVQTPVDQQDSQAQQDPQAQPDPQAQLDPQAQPDQQAQTDQQDQTQQAQTDTTVSSR